MDSESNVIHFPQVKQVYQEISLLGYQILSPEEFIQTYPDIAKITGLDQVIELEEHTADIIDAKDPEIWKKKDKGQLNNITT